MVRALKNRVEQLEQQIAKQNQKVAQVETVAQEAKESSESISLPGVEFHGAVEVEMASGEDHTGAHSSDVKVAKVELGFDFTAFDNWITGTFLALHEDDDTDPWVVDEAHFTIGNTEEFPIYFSAGRKFVPFGNFESNMVSDPLTLEIGETREAVVQLGFEKEGWYGSAYAFNGDLDDMGISDKIENFGWNIGKADENDSYSYDVGFSRINHIGDSNGITDALNGATPAVTNVQDYIAAYGLHGIYRTGQWSFVSEYIAASESFRANELAWRGRGARPSAYNLEIGYDFVAFGGRDINFALGLQGTDQAVGLGQPEKKLLTAFSTSLYENTSLALEYVKADDYSVADGGTGKSGDSITVQMAVEF